MAGTIAELVKKQKTILGMLRPGAQKNLPSMAGYRLPQLLPQQKPQQNDLSSLFERRAQLADKSFRGIPLDEGEAAEYERISKEIQRAESPQQSPQQTLQPALPRMTNATDVALLSRATPEWMKQQRGELSSMSERRAQLADLGASATPEDVSEFERLNKGIQQKEDLLRNYGALDTGERIGGEISGSLKNFGAGTANSILMLARQMTSAPFELGAKLGGAILGKPEAEKAASSILNQTWEKAADIPSGIAKSGAKDIEAAQKGASPLGKAALDILGSAVQMGAAAATGGLTGIGYLPAFGIQAGGSAALQAREQGKTPEQQALYGLASGVSEALIESLGGIGASKISKAVAKTAVGKLMSKLPEGIVRWANTKGAKVVGGILSDIASESGEEGLSYNVDRVLQKLILHNNVPFDIKQMAYQMLIGGAVGGLFGGGHAIVEGARASVESAPEAKAAPVTAQEDVETPKTQGGRTELSSRERFVAQPPRMSDAVNETQSKDTAGTIKTGVTAKSGVTGSPAVSFNTNIPQNVSGVNIKNEAQGAKTALEPPLPRANGAQTKINPADRPRIREIAGPIDSNGYEIPKLSLPEELLVDESGNPIAPEKRPSALRKYMLSRFKGKTLQIGREHKAYVNRDGIKEFAFSVKRFDEKIKLAKHTAGANLDATLEPARFLLNVKDDGRHQDVTGGWDNFYVMFETDDGVYSGIVKTKLTDRGRVFYDITEIQQEGGLPPTHGDNGANPPPAKTEPPSINATVPQNVSGVNIKNSAAEAKTESNRRGDAESLPAATAEDGGRAGTGAPRTDAAGGAAWRETYSAPAPDEIKALAEKWRAAKAAKKALEAAERKNRLPEAEREVLDLLMRGELSPAGIPEGVDAKAVLEVYNARKAYKETKGPLDEYRRRMKAALYEEADGYLAGSERWKDKPAGILYQRETMERNIRDIVPDKAAAEAIIGRYFTPVHVHEAQRTRMKNDYRNRVRALNLSRSVAKGNKVSEAYAVQFLGEVEDNIAAIEESKGRIKERNGGTLSDWKAAKEKLLLENPNMDWAKVSRAVAEFRKIYDELFGMMNEARIRNGYEPVDYRRGYFPHFKADKADDVISALAKALGIKTEVTNLPTDIAGITHMFRPGIRWFGHALRREGFATDYDALEGFDRYIEGISDVIYHTDDIQALRALEEQIRYRYSDENIRREVRALRERTDLSEEERQSLIEEKLRAGAAHLANFVTELNEYTNLLANKKSVGDRGVEHMFGRRVYNLAKWLENRIAANMVAANPASWLTNFIVLTQGWATVRTDTLLRAMWDTLKSYKASDGLRERSTFLTNRRGSDPLVRTLAERATGIAGKPFEYIDHFTADALVRARYYDNVRKGMDESSALDEADKWAASVMADRSKGALPTIFETRNPLVKVFTQFQVEVNNQLSHLLKDIPRETKERGLKALVAALIKYCLGAWLYNELYERLTGRRPALDPIGILADTAGDIAGGRGAKQAMTTLTKGVAENLPFVGGLLGGGRLPISSALPDIVKLGGVVSGLATGEMNREKALETIGKELAKPAAYILPPFGGGQIKKAVEGITTVSRGGSFSKDREGRDVMQYPVFNASPFEAAKNYAQAVIFGKSALPTAREWIRSGFQTSTAKETAAYRALVGLGVDPERAYRVVQDVSNAKGTEQKSLDRAKKDALNASGLGTAEKAALYFELLAEKDELDKVQEYAKAAGIPVGKAKEVHAALALLEPERGKTAASDYQKVTAVMKQGLTEKQTAAIAGLILGKGKESLLPYLKNAGTLLRMYAVTANRELINMYVPDEFAYTPPKQTKVKSGGLKTAKPQRRTYVLTDAEKKLFRETYAKEFAGALGEKPTLDDIKKAKDIAYEAAKLAVVQSRG